MHRRLNAAELVPRAVGFQVFASSRFAKPPSWECSSALWALARIPSPNGGSNKSRPEPGNPFSTKHETRDTVFLLPLGTEALQSFFPAPVGIA